MCRLCGILMFSFMFLLIVGCSSEEPSPKTPAPAKQALPSERDLWLMGLEEQFERIKSYAATYPREIEKIRIQVNSFKAQAAGTKFEALVEKLAALAQEKFRQDAQAAYHKAREEVEKLIAQGNRLAALEALEEYPAEFVSTEWQEKLNEMAEPIEREAEADRKMDALRDEVKALLENNNPEAALEMINDYPEWMRTGSRKAGWEKMHNEVSAKVEAIMARKRKEEALAWDELFAGEDMFHWSPRTGEWELRDDLLVGKYAGDSAGYVYCGTADSPWSDFVLEVEFNLVCGDYLVIGVRGRNEGGRSVFDQIDFLPEVFARGEFHEVAIEARGDTYLIREKGSKRVFSQKAKAGYTKGPIGFFISPGAEVHIRRVRIKRLK